VSCGAAILNMDLYFVVPAMDSGLMFCVTSILGDVYVE